ncbi:hypothetical protein RQP53_01845 [Paucibacter sp. APW11]|uniref:Uncharacterized protein n=1 Tax=Roseateles aquae TaxID=3077235 RepID=A0ABU3P614_9BURK|nr:hypothetical protein [Paucibacter sp. APW11]MDT8998011.1 hypothetical protein [Paucibacter sp. APW11]
MKRTLLALTNLSREPQNWINLIGISSVLALMLGAFEPAESGVHQAGAGAVVQQVLVASVSSGEGPSELSAAR